MPTLGLGDSANGRHADGPQLVCPPPVSPDAQPWQPKMSQLQQAQQAPSNVPDKPDADFHRIEKLLDTLLDSQGELLGTVDVVRVYVQEVRSIVRDVFGASVGLTENDRAVSGRSSHNVAFQVPNLDGIHRAEQSFVRYMSPNKSEAIAATLQRYSETGWSPRVSTESPLRMSNPGVTGAPSDLKQARTSDDGAHEFLAPTLPRGWPKVVEMRDGFPDLMEVQAKFSNSGVQDNAFERRMSAAAASPAEEGIGVEWDVVRSRCCNLAPESWGSTVHNLLGVMMLLLDLSLIPFVLAWALEVDVLYGACSAAFWTADIMLSATTGYYEKGTIVMDRRKILGHYLQTWAGLDILACFTDWFSIAIHILTAGSGDGTGLLKLVRFVKLSRFLRIIGAFRLLKFQQMVRDFSDRQLSETTRFVHKIINFAVAFLWCNHLLTCLWYAIGRHGTSAVAQSWIDLEAPGLEQPYSAADVQFQYFVAFHWSLAQVTLGATNLQSVNTPERIANILYLLFGLLVTTVMVSSLSASMVDLQISQKDRKDKLRTLRTFLRENSINTRLANCVQQQVLERLASRGRLHVEDVTSLTLVTRALQMQLRFDISKQHIMKVPLFRLWISLDQRTVQNFFMQPLEVLHIRAKDDVFLAGAVGEAAYIVTCGELTYTQEPASSPQEEVVTKTVMEKEFIAEACLFSKWIHVGTASATNNGCEVLSVKAEALMEALRKHGVIREITVEYGHYFHQRLRLAGPPSTLWPDDLTVPFTDFGDMVRCMSIDLQATIGFDSLRYLSRPKQGSHAKLKQEIAAGKCVVIVDGEGEVRRCVSLVTLRLTRADGSIFCQVGKLNPDTGSTDASCQLPGTKFEWREGIEEAIPRVLKMKIPCFSDHCRSSKVECEVQTIVSQAFGVPTTYMRVVCHLGLNESVACPAWRARSQRPIEVPMTRTQTEELQTLEPRKSIGRNYTSWLHLASDQPEPTTDNEKKTKAVTWTESASSHDSGEPAPPRRSHSNIASTLHRGATDWLGMSRWLGGRREDEGVPSQPSVAYGSGSNPSVCLSSESAGGNLKKLCEELREKDVYIVKEDGNSVFNLYAWLNPEEFAMLKKDGSMELLLDPWLTSLDIPVHLQQSL